MADKKLKYESRETVYNRAIRAIAQDSMIVQYTYKIENLSRAASMFEELGNYKDAAEKALFCRKKIDKLCRDEKEYAYNQAQRRFEDAQTAGEYDKAEELFEQISGYKDADEKRAESIKRSNQLVQKTRIQMLAWFIGISAAIVLTILFFKSSFWARTKAAILDEPYVDNRLPIHEQELAYLFLAHKGDTVDFAGLKWIVLSKAEEKAILLLENPSDHRELKGIPFQEDQKEANWENSSLRRWLNTTFLEEHFSEEELAMMSIRSSGTLENNVYQTDGGTETEERIGILNLVQANRYKKLLKEYKKPFWLCTPGHSMDTAAYVSGGGTVMAYGYPIDSTDLYVCPVIEVALS